MMIHRIWGLALIVLALTGCASVKFSGTSQASPKLRGDTLAMLQPFFLAKTGCEQITSVEADIPGLPPFMKTGNVRAFLDKPLPELWVANGCGKQAAFDIDFTPDGAGGAFIGVKSVPVAP